MTKDPAPFSVLLAEIAKLDTLPERLSAAVVACADPEGTDAGSRGYVRFGPKGIFFSWPTTGKVLRFSLPTESSTALSWTKIVGVSEAESGYLGDYADVASLFEWLIEG